MSPAALRCFQLDDGCGLQLSLMDWGATWLGARLHGRELLLGHATPADYARGTAYLGAVVGRTANRIAGAAFTLGGRQHRVLANEGANQLHGGPQGWHARRWQAGHGSATLQEFHLDDGDGHQGFPGALHACARYELVAAGTLQLSFELHNLGPQATLAGPTSHAYFSLDGPQRGVLQQRLQMPAARLLPVRPDLIPLGSTRPVQGSAFDFRSARRIADGLAQGAAAHDEQLAIAGGYDHCWLLDEPLCTLTAADERVALQLSSSYPALQFYGGQYLARSPGANAGRDGQPLPAHAGLALEPQYPPDTPNHLGEAGWPQQGFVLQPGEHRRHHIRYHFEAR